VLGCQPIPHSQEAAMKKAIYALAGLLLMTLLPAAQAAEGGVVYVVSYFEVAPAAKDKAIEALRLAARQSQKEAGNLRYEILQRINQPDQFVVLEAWKDKDAHAAHAGAGHTKQFREKLQPLLRGPYDERPHSALEVGEVTAKPGNDAIFLVTHVDIVPKEKDIGVALTKDLAATGRKSPHNVRFEALTQVSRPNHMTVVEIWSDRRSLEAHSVAPHMKQYREKLMPMSGSLYDERHYRSIK
jgi:quinol monooxygenase YgiN